MNDDDNTITIIAITGITVTTKHLIHCQFHYIYISPAYNRTVAFKTFDH